MSRPEGRIENENRQLYKKLARIAVPISIQGVVSATLNLIDNLMVGFLGRSRPGGSGHRLADLFHPLSDTLWIHQRDCYLYGSILWGKGL